jgi:DNA-binding transcriptional MerR regulator
MLGLSPATVDRLTKRGLLRPSRAIRRPLYSEEEIQRFVRETTGGNLNR